MLKKNMKRLVLDFNASICLQVKIKGKYFHTFEVHLEGWPALKRLLHEHTTLLAHDLRLRCFNLQQFVNFINLQ